MRGFGSSVCVFRLCSVFRSFVGVFFVVCCFPPKYQPFPPLPPKSLPSPTIHFLTFLLGSAPSPSPKFKNHPQAPAHLFWPEPSMTLETKLTMAAAGWSGSSSAKRWQMLSVVLPCFLATKPKSLGGKKATDLVRSASVAHPKNTTSLFQHCLVHLPVFNTHLTHNTEGDISNPPAQRPICSSLCCSFFEGQHCVSIISWPNPPCFDHPCHPPMDCPQEGTFQMITSSPCFG